MELEIHNASCWGENGTVIASPTGGVLPYTLKFTGSSGEIAGATVSLPADTYTVTLSDGNSCTSNYDPITISQPGLLIISQHILIVLIVIADALSLQIEVTNASCWGMQGSVLPVPSGGVPPYTFSYHGLTNNFTQNSITDFALDVGSYDAFVTDANNCHYGPVRVEISQPGMPSKLFHLHLI